MWAMCVNTVFNSGFTRLLRRDPCDGRQCLLLVHSLGGLPSLQMLSTDSLYAPGSCLLKPFRDRMSSFSFFASPGLPQAQHLGRALGSQNQSRKKACSPSAPTRFAIMILLQARTTPAMVAVQEQSSVHSANYSSARMPTNIYFDMVGCLVVETTRGALRPYLDVQSFGSRVSPFRSVVSRELRSPRTETLILSLPCSRFSVSRDIILSCENM